MSFVVGILFVFTKTNILLPEIILFFLFSKEGIYSDLSNKFQ